MQTSKTTFNNDQPRSGKEKRPLFRDSLKESELSKRKIDVKKISKKIQKNWNNLTKLQKNLKNPINFL